MENKVTADYLDEEGCLHCGICGKRKQMKVSLMGFEHVVSCLCECEVKARQELDEKMQREEAQITHRINSTNTVYQKDLDDIKELMEKIWQLQKSMVSKQPLIKQ